MEGTRARRAGNRPQPPAPPQPVYEDFHPAVEWTHDSTNHVLHIYLPGFARGDLRVQVENADKLTVKGVRKERDGLFMKVEESYPLPKDSTPDKIIGRFEDGRLTLQIPKKPTPPPAQPPQPLEKPVQPQQPPPQPSSQRQAKPPSPPQLQPSTKPVQPQQPPPQPSSQPQAKSPSSPPLQPSTKPVQPQQKPPSPPSQAQAKPPPPPLVKPVQPQQQPRSPPSQPQGKPPLPSEPDDKSAQQPQQLPPTPPLPPSKSQEKEEPQRLQTSEEKEKQVVNKVAEKATQTDEDDFMRELEEEIRKKKRKLSQDVDEVSSEARKKWKVGVVEWKEKGREVLLDCGQKVENMWEKINRNRNVIAVAVVAFSVGFYVSHKLRTTGR